MSVNNFTAVRLVSNITFMINILKLIIIKEKLTTTCINFKPKSNTTEIIYNRQNSLK